MKKNYNCKISEGCDEISSCIGWNDVVDSLTVISKIARVNAHEVSMKEKRRKSKEVGM